MGRRWIAGILFGLLSGSPCFSQSVVGTTTAPDGLWSASHFYVHCAAGRYWVAYHDGTQPVIKSSADGSNWTALGNIFSLGGASLTYTWSVRYLGTTIIAVRYLAGTNTRYYRNGTLNPDGSIAWAAADLASGPTGSSWEYSSALIANGKPIYWRSDTGNSSQGRFRIGNQINSPSFYATSGDAPSLGTATGGRFSSGAVFPLGGSDPDDLIALRATTETAYGAGNHRLVAIKYDASLDTDPYEASWYNVSTLNGGLTEDATTEVKEATDGVAHQLFSASRDSNGRIHAVYVNRNDDVVHYRKDAGFNDIWSRISADVTQSTAIDRVALEATGGDNLVLYYSKSDNRIYSRAFNGTSWGGETNVKTSTTPLQGALAPMESYGACGANLAWVEGAGSPYNVTFLAGAGSCPDLVTAEGSGTLTVTAPGSFEMVFDTVAGAGIRKMFDLAEDPGRSHDLAGSPVALPGSPKSLHTSGMNVAGLFYNSGNNDFGAQIQLIEATQTRVRVRQAAHYEHSATGAVLPGVEASGDYSIYPSGRFAVEWNRKTTMGLTYNSEYHEMAIHYTSGVDPLNTWATFSETAGFLGSDDFILAQNENTVVNPGAVTDFLKILYQDWSTTNGYSATADSTFAATNAGAERINFYWNETTGAALGANVSETWNFLNYSKPTTLVDNNDTAATTRRDDYRGADILAMNQGSGWFDSSEYTASPNDFFNESEAAYALDLNTASGLDFEIDGGTTTRYAPFFKIRQWRSLSASPTVDFTGAITTWTAEQQTGDTNLGPSNNGILETHRVLIDSASLSQSGTQIRILLRGHPTNPAPALSNFHIAEVDVDDRDVVDASWTQITFNSGATTVAVPAGGSVWSDWSSRAQARAAVGRECPTSTLSIRGAGS